MGNEVAAENQSKPVKVLVAGGCYAGLATSITILERCDSASPRIPVSITIVDERDGYYHVVGTPLALADMSYAEKTWVKFENVRLLQRPDVQFVHGSVKHINLKAKTAVITRNDEETTEKYDFFVGATSLRRGWPAVPQARTRDSYLEEMRTHIEAVASSKHPILVVGGGAVGIEIAAELTVCHPNTKVILAHSRDKLLSSEPLPDDFKDRALNVLQETGVEVLLSHRLESSTAVDGANEVVFTNGKKLVAGVVIKAMVKSIPSTSFLPKEALNEEGFINVLPSLQLSGDLPNNEYHFAAGDVVNWSGIKRCGGAMHMGKLVGDNIHLLIVRGLSSSAKKLKFKEMRQIPPMITVAIGKEAVSYGPPFGTSSGKWLMQVFFGEDLGFRRTLDFLRLGAEPGSVGSWKEMLGNVLTILFPSGRNVWSYLAPGQKHTPAVIAST